MSRLDRACDPFDLGRFLQAQDGVYARALQELRAGRKRSHWMWFVLPQIEGLGVSPTAGLYAIKSRAEAAAYVAHPVLGPRLLECCEAVLVHRDRTAHEIFGSPDDLKLRSCATLFEAVAPAHDAFARLIDVFYGGERDRATLQRLAAMRS